MKLRSRCFPLEYYPGEVLTEVEARRRRKHITCYTLIICSLWASNLGVRQIKSETNGFQTRTEIHRVIHDLRGGVNLTETAWLLITIWMLNQQSMGFQPVRQAPPPPHHQLFGGLQNYLLRMTFRSLIRQVPLCKWRDHQSCLIKILLP